METTVSNLALLLAFYTTWSPPVSGTHSDSLRRSLLNQGDRVRTVSNLALLSAFYTTWSPPVSVSTLGLVHPHSGLVIPPHIFIAVPVRNMAFNISVELVTFLQSIPQAINNITEDYVAPEMHAHVEDVDEVY